MAKKKVEDMTQKEKEEYLEKLKAEINKLRTEMNMENMSAETVIKIEKMGWEHIINSVPKKDSYFHGFSNYTDNLTFVKSPLEVNGVWLASLWSHVNNKSYQLPEKYGYTVDSLGRTHLETEEDVLKFAKDVTDYLAEEYEGRDRDELLKEIVMRRFGKKFSL